MSETEERRDLFPPVFLTIVIFVFGLLAWALVSDSNSEEQGRERCSASNGTYLELYSSDDVCLRKDSVIFVE